jgi:thymidylate synthase
MQQNNQLNHDFRTCLMHLMHHGMESHPRGTTTKELLNYNITLGDPRNRIINYADRKTSLKYLLGEFIWYISGSNDPAGILPYAKFWDGIRNLGDNELYPAGTVNSNYGTRLFGHSKLPAFSTKASTLSKPEPINQWQETILALARDKDTRQAVMSIHVPSDRHVGNKDVPCTFTLQWLIRENRLHLIVNMRSNDIILGFTNDVFQFTMLQEAMMLELRRHWPDLELGVYYHNAGSMHIYSRHFSMAEAIIKDERALEMPMIKMDVFSDEILTGLVGIEAAWQAAGASKDFAFEDVGAWELLTPYWQNLVLMCFGERDEAMHVIFGVPEHEDQTNA